MKLKKVTSWMLLFVLTATSVANADDIFKKLMKDNGFELIQPPRAEFGTGTIIPIKQASRNKQLYIAADNECFPDISRFLHSNAIALPSSIQSKDLDISAS